MKWRWFINVCNRGRVASNLRQLAAHLPHTKERCKSIHLAYETRDHDRESQWLRISSLEEMWRKERTGISFTSVMFVDEVCKNAFIHVDLHNVNKLSVLGLTIPLGSNGIRVLNVPQLSAQPCRHSTGRPLEGPQTWPLISPHGTVILNSDAVEVQSQN